MTSQWRIFRYFCLQGVFVFSYNLPAWPILSMLAVDIHLYMLTIPKIPQMRRTKGKEKKKKRKRVLLALFGRVYDQAHHFIYYLVISPTFNFSIERLWHEEGDNYTLVRQ